MKSSKRKLKRMNRKKLLTIVVGKKIHFCCGSALFVWQLDSSSL